MSIIIAVKKGDTVYMGTDTQTSFGGFKTNHNAPSNYKIIKMEDGLLVGFVGNVRTSQLLLSKREIFKLDKKKGLTKEGIVNEIIPEILEVIDDNEAFENDEDEDERLDIGCSMLLAYKDKVYHLSRDLSIMKINHYAAIGYGDNAQYLLQNFDYEGDANAQLIRIMKNCEKLSHTVSHPFVLINSKDLTFERVEEDL